MDTCKYFLFFCLPGRARTCDPLIKSQLLCQLSYGEIYFKYFAKV